MERVVAKEASARYTPEATTCRWRITKSPEFRDFFEILVRCRHARHPRRSRSFDRHRRSAYKTGWPSCRRRGIGAHSASDCQRAHNSVTPNDGFRALSGPRTSVKGTALLFVAVLDEDLQTFPRSPALE